MRIAIINGQEVTVLRGMITYRQHANRPDDILRGREILCIVCKEPKFIRNEDFKAGRSLAHLGCSNKVKFKHKHEDKELQKQIVLTNIINKLNHQIKRRKLSCDLTREQISNLVFSNCQTVDKNQINYITNIL